LILAKASAMRVTIPHPANFPRCLTAYVSLDNESSGITVPPASLQRKALQAADEDAASTKRPSEERAASLNANEVLMLYRRLKMPGYRNALRKRIRPR
jgi:hypothetical protein